MSSRDFQETSRETPQKKKKKKRERERKTQKRKQLGKQTKQAQHRTHGPNKVFCNLKAAQSKAEHLEKFLRF